MTRKRSIWKRDTKQWQKEWKHTLFYGWKRGGSDCEEAFIIVIDGLSWAGILHATCSLTNRHTNSVCCSISKHLLWRFTQHLHDLWTAEDTVFLMSYLLEPTHMHNPMRCERSAFKDNHELKLHLIYLRVCCCRREDRKDTFPPLRVVVITGEQLVVVGALVKLKNYSNNKNLLGRNLKQQALYSERLRHDMQILFALVFAPLAVYCLDVLHEIITAKHNFTSLW